jgi:cardiolipin synthase
MPTGELSICVVSSSAGESYSNVGLAFALAIAAAQQQILIQNPYFAPDRHMLDLLCDASQRGVLVQLMLPGSRTDSIMLRLAARHLYPQLLDAGVEIYEYQPSLSHQKIMVVDEKFARIGSTNLDCRSLELNAEAGIATVDSGVAQELARQFADDLQDCRRIESGELRTLSWGSRAAAAGLYFLRSQL